MSKSYKDDNLTVNDTRQSNQLCENSIFMFFSD